MDPLNPINSKEPTLNPKEQADVMNDSAYDPKAPRNDKTPEDADTCRICRGEGSLEEPLFYPCKCSGSIKFVHQNCLMEWLSHSQKKHCELCKTPFRFTKLYDAHMPKSVPVPVFLRQAAIHTWKSLLTWSRFHLVAFVWVFWLPWCMRAVWRGLFWVGDGSWVDWKRRSLQDATASMARQEAASASIYVAPTIPMSREDIASTLVSQFSSRLPKVWTPVTQIFQFERGEPLTLRMLRRLYHAFFSKSVAVASSLSEANATAIAGPMPRSASWLADIPFLKSLTRSTIINNIIIDTLEGQIITMCIVVAFILIFLIREWVMQQQQNLQLGPDGNQNGVLPQNPVAQAPRRRDLQVRNQAVEQAGQAQAVRDEVDNRILARPAARMLARPRPRLQRRATNPEVQEIGQNGDTTANETAMNAADVVQHESGASQHSETQSADLSHRPTMPDRGMIAKAVEIRRTLDEHSRDSPDHDGSGAQVFKDLWSRAGQNPSEVLQIIEEENRTEELDWIVNFMRKLEGAPRDLRMSAASQVNYLSKRDQQKSANQRGDKMREDMVSDLADVQLPRVSQPESSDQVVRDLKNHSVLSSSPLEGNEENHVPEHLDLMRESSATALRPDKNPPALPDPPRPLSMSDAGRRAFEEALPEQTNLPDYTIRDEEPAPIGSPVEESPDVVMDNVADIAPEPLPSGRSTLECLMELMWGGVPLPNDHVDQPAGDEEHVVNDIANEAPFVPVARGQHLIPAQNEAPDLARDPDVVAAAVQAGIDPNGREALDEIEDLEGIMELIGMQGPIVGLIQNGMFCALLVSLTITATIWVPYMFGKVFLTLLNHPLHLLKQPLRFASTSADMIVDFAVFAAGCSFFWVDIVFGMVCTPVGWLVPPIGKVARNQILAETAKDYAERALERLAKASMANGDFVSRICDLPKFSVVAHESLQNIQAKASALFEGAYHMCVESFSIFDQGNDVATALATAVKGAKESAAHVIARLLDLLSLAPALLQINPLRINLARSHRTAPFDYTLAAWNAKDRSIAIICGYMFFALLGVVYLHLAAAIRGTNKKGKVESGLADVLYQAGGVMKVVLIISIEMIIFPLYCGLLLDAALLPLFGNATFTSRIQFMMDSPNTSLFIHWFIGTCYMFHFALFVSMCRKIMRNGVLCKYQFLSLINLLTCPQSLYGIQMTQPFILFATYWNAAFQRSCGKSHSVH